MKSTSFFTLLFFMALSLSTFSQKKQAILFKIDGKPQLVSDFEKNYLKNIDIVADSSQKKITNYLELYINYKLKVQAAYNLKLDTLSTFVGELSRYKQQLMTPYLKDSVALENLAKEAYYRSKYEVNASHILIRLEEGALPKDTLAAYNLISKARKEIIDGQKFKDVAVKYSQDPSAKKNFGNLGYFKVFQMVYPFENAAYTTPVGKISPIFKTRYGYHILKINNKRLSQGEVEVAHIMLKNKDAKSIAVNKLKIDSIYAMLKEGQKFAELAKKYSQDSGSAQKGGKLAKFGVGKIIKEFSDAAFALKSIGDYSKPFKTRYGWHIVTLLKKYPIDSYDKMRSELLKKVKRGERAEQIEKSVIDKLKKTYVILEYKSALADFKNPNWFKKKDSLNSPILKVQDSIFTQKDLVVYLSFKKIKKYVSNQVFNKFKDRKIIDYYKAHLEDTNKEYATSVNEFKEGLLLFDIMQNKVWQKAKADSTGLKAFYMLNRTKYPKDFKNNKGVVMNDYQTYLEKIWIAGLRKKHPIEINKRALKKLIRKYE
ncbi:MAG: peptidylprolyl isomerase [Flavobacteriaceae bacterium]